MRSALASLAGPVADSGLPVPRLFTRPGADPLDEIVWAWREVRGAGGRRINERQPVEAPGFWSQTAVDVVARRYLRNGPEGPERSIRQAIERVAGTIARWGAEGGYFAREHDADVFRSELAHVLVHQLAAFNSPVWFNVGVEAQPQCAACFIVSVDDDLESILAWNALEARIFQRGSGAGVNLSRIRGAGESIAGGGTASGPLAFMRGADAWAGAMGAGGSTKRAAKMVVLDADHPDIHAFVTAKEREEERAAALVAAGFDLGLGGADAAALPFQFANHSVRASDAFMRAAERDELWWMRARTTGQPIGAPQRARDLLRTIAASAWRCADPGMQFDTTINAWHTTPAAGRITASNPCAEFMHVDDSACNLASINLLRFLRQDGTIDLPALEHVVDLLVTAQDILVGASSYPTPAIASNSIGLRPLGLGYTNLGSYLMAAGLPYDSDAGRATAAAVTALIGARAYHRSALLAAALGPYPEFSANRDAHLAVVDRHHAACETTIAREACADRALLGTARMRWAEAQVAGARHGYRNSQVTALAPTGTISFLMDCDTTGVEPAFSLVATKQFADGGRARLVNRAVASGLRRIGYAADEVRRLSKHATTHGTLAGAPGLRSRDLATFDTAVGPRAIASAGHVRMVAAVQPFLSGGVSKTVNLPNTATVDDVENTFMLAWRLGVKAVAVYRDGSKATQVLTAHDPEALSGDCSGPACASGPPRGRRLRRR